MSRENTPVANSTMVLREEFDDWAVLFDPDSGDAFGLNPVGVYIWKRLDGTRTREDILEELLKDCDNVPEDARPHMDEFIQDLVSRGFAGYEVGRK